MQRSEQVEQTGKTLVLLFPDRPLPHLEAPATRRYSSETPRALVSDDPPKPVLSLPENLFIGRQSESEKLLAWSRGTGKRLLTLTGMGGMGKTRLALELSRVCERPVRFVPLAELRDPTSLIPTLLRTSLWSLRPAQVPGSGSSRPTFTALGSSCLS